MPSRMIYLLKLSVDSSELKEEPQHSFREVSPQVFLENMRNAAFGRRNTGTLEK